MEEHERTPRPGLREFFSPELRARPKPYQINASKIYSRGEMLDLLYIQSRKNQKALGFLIRHWKRSLSRNNLVGNNRSIIESKLEAARKIQNKIIPTMRMNNQITDRLLSLPESLADEEEIAQKTNSMIEEGNALNAKILSLYPDPTEIF